MSGLGIESICTANGESPQHLRSSVLGSLAMPALRFSVPNYLTLVRQFERVGYFHCWSFSLLHLFLFLVCSRHNRVSSHSGWIQTFGRIPHGVIFISPSFTGITFERLNMWPSLDCFYDWGGDIKMGLHNGD